MKEEVLKDCRGCFRFDSSECSFVWFDEEHIECCPCRNCLVKPVCIEYFCPERREYADKLFDIDPKTARLWATYR